MAAKAGATAFPASPRLQAPSPSIRGRLSRLPGRSPVETAARIESGVLTSNLLYLEAIQ